MDFALSPRAAELAAVLEDFMRELVYPAEAVYREQMRAAGTPHYQPPVLEELKEQARARGLWNLFLPHKTEWTDGLSNLDYAPLCEILGRSFIAPEVLNCSAPDTGNMELLTLFGTTAQQERWLRPLLAGQIRSAFLMTEPAVASSDATNIQTRIERDGGDWVINGHKWWISGTGDPRCRLGIVMGKTDQAATSHEQQSMILVPLDSPGITIQRDLTVFGYNDREGHCEIVLDNVRVPADSLLGTVGGGFAMAQARLGPGRIHHCMRSIGAAERALELLCLRARDRVAFGGPLADKGVVQEAIANSRIEIDQARLMTLYAAWLMDTAGNKAARGAISASKVAVPQMAARVIDRAIQVHGGAGLSQDFPLAQAYALQRYLRLADGPDEVHRTVVAKLELRKYADRLHRQSFEQLHDRQADEGDEECDLLGKPAAARPAGSDGLPGDLANSGAAGEGVAGLHGQVGDGAGFVGVHRLLHFHRLQDEDQVAGAHLLALRHRDLDHGSLHRGGQGIPRGSRTCLPAPQPALRLAAARRSSGGAAAPGGGQRDLEALAVDLDDDDLPVGLPGCSARPGAVGVPRRELVTEFSLDPAGVHGERPGTPVQLWGEGGVGDDGPVKRQDGGQPAGLEFGQRPGGALQCLRAGGAGDDELGKQRVPGRADHRPGLDPGVQPDARPGRRLP